MGNKKVKLLAMLSGFLIVVLIMFRDSFQTGKMLFGTDTITIYMAFAEFAKKMVTVYHSLPAWLPDIYMGMPMIGSSSLLFFYPTDLLFMLLPVPLQFMYVPDIIIHMFLAALGMYLFLKKLKIEQPAALFGSAAIMTAGYIISYIYAGHWNNIKAGALIPLTFYFIQCALSDKKLLHYLNTAFILALMMFAAAMQVMAYTFLAIIFYAAFYIIFIEKEKKEKIKNGIYLAACAAFILLFSAPQFIPSIQYTNWSWRGDVSYSNFISWSFHPAELISFLLPQFFGLFSNSYWGYMPFTLTTYYFGIIPFLLLFFLAVPGGHKKHTIFFAVSAVVFMFFAFGGYTFIYRLFYFVPVFKQFRNPSRFIYLVTFFTVTLASIGLNNMLEGKDEKKKFKIWLRLAGSVAVFTMLFLILLGSGGLESLLSSAYYSIKNTAMPAGVMSATKVMIKSDLVSFIFVSLAALSVIFIVIKKKVKSAFIAALILASINFADVYRIDSKFITFKDYSVFIPINNPVTEILLSDREPFRIANFDQVFGPNRNIYYGIENLNGTHGLMPAAYIKMEAAKSFNNIAINRQFNIRYYLNNTDIGWPGFVKVLDTGSLKLFRDTYSKNRIFYPDRIIRTVSKQAMLDYLNSASYTGEEVIVGPDFPQESFLPANGSVVITEYTPDRVKAVVDSKSGGAVVHCAAYYPEWKAKIDGKPAKVYNVNFYSMAVAAPSGRHEIEFFYDKSGIYMGFLIAFIAFIFYGYIIFKSKKAG